MRTGVAALLFVLSLQCARAIERPETPPAPAWSGKHLFVAVLAGQRAVQADWYEPVYGSGKMFYRGEIGYRFDRRAELVLGAEVFKAEGTLTYTQEATTLKIMPVELGARLLLADKGRLAPYIGAGFGYYMIKEENAIGTVDEKKFGFYGEAGLQVRLVSALYADARVKYVSVSLPMANEPAVKANLGGLALAAGLGVSF